MFTVKQIASSVSVVVMIFSIIGCQKRSQKFPEKAPRPVTVLPLRQSVPESNFIVSGYVKSWKTENIGFEVSGRLQFVLEPGENIEGQIRDSDGNLLQQGTPLAKIDPARYQVAVESAKASLDVAKLDKEVIQIRITDTIPKDIETARADVKLAQTNYDRLKSLRTQNAVSQSEFDNAANRLETETARLSNLESSQKQANTELRAAEARVKNAQQTLEDAERNLRNTTLYASYRGQISAVDVVPGSVVSTGSPILTLQMMDPIKIEIEVSAELSREIQRRRQIPITFSLPDGTKQNQNAFVHLVDPSADPSTRTFTVTLLFKNQQYRPALPKRLLSLPIARTQHVWPLNISQIIGQKNGLFFIEENAIETDGDTSYVWLIPGVKLGDTLAEVVTIRKEKIKASAVRIPFLGNWFFRQVTFENPDIPETGIVAGKLEFPSIDRAQWDSKTLFIDSGNQWLLRPGDLVSVNIKPESTKPGMFVPIEAIYDDAGEAFIFVENNGVAKKTKIKARLPEKLETGSLIRIEPVAQTELAEGMRIVVGGVHYLNDGDSINVVEVLTPQGAEK